MLADLLLSIPLGDAQWFDTEPGREPVLVHREEDPNGPWFEVDGACLTLDEILLLLSPPWGEP